MSSSSKKNIFCNSCTIPGWVCRHKSCKFAHTIDEIQPIACKYRDCIYKWSAGRNRCKFIHNETIEGYANRLRFQPGQSIRGNTIIERKIDHVETLIYELHDELLYLHKLEARQDEKRREEMKHDWISEHMLDDEYKLLSHSEMEDEYRDWYNDVCKYGRKEDTH